DEARDGLLAILFDPLGSLFLGRTANFSDQDDPMCIGIVVEELDDVEVRGAVDRIAADADAGALADTATGELPHRLIRQGAAAGHHADVSFLMNVGGRNANPAATVGILASTRRDNA